MNIAQHIYEFLTYSDFFQSFVFGGIMLYLYFIKKKPTLFLALFLICNGVETLCFTMEYIWRPEDGYLYVVPLTFTYLMTPLFYIYVKKISILDEEKIEYRYLIPGFVEILLGIFIYFQSDEIKVAILDSLGYILFLYFGIFYNMFIIYKVLKGLNRHIKKLENQYSDLLNKQLIWTRNFLIIFFTYSILVAFESILFKEYLWVEVIFSIIDLILVYWVGIQGLFQEKIYSIIPQKITEEIKPSGVIEDDKKLVVKDDESDLEEEQTKIIEIATTFIETSKIYTKTDLTIIDLSEAIDIHPKKISNAINSKLEINFNRYINKFRIEKAKTLLKDPEIKLSIEGIGLESGFKSKSAFYNAFKDIVAMTPAKYKLEQV